MPDWARPGARGLVMLVWLGAGCGGGEPGPERPAADPAERVLERETGRIEARAAEIDSILQPLPLMRPAQEAGLRRFPNAAQLARARRLGVGRSLPPERLEALVGAGRLIRLESTEHWVVREMEASSPLVVPSVRALLSEIGARFHARLSELGLPGFRFEVSSALRSEEDQAALRRVNPNAAPGESTHEYGTTVDVLYSAFSAPAVPIAEIDARGAAWLEPFLGRYADVSAERVAGRRALELRAILAEVLLEMQNEGKVMVTFERLQPVFHMTVARELEAE